MLEVAGGGVAPQPLLSVLASELRQAGYTQAIAYDIVMGFRIISLPGDTPSASNQLLSQLGLTPGESGYAPAGVDLFSQILERIVGFSEGPVALIADFASQLTIRNDALSAAEHQAFSRALLASHQARLRPYGSPPRPFYNTVIWVVDKEGDLPDWLLIDNPRIRHIPIAKPDHVARRPLAQSLLRSFVGYSEAAPSILESALNAFVEQTEGLLLLDMTSIAQLARTEGVRITAVGDAVRRYKIGVTDDPWMRINREKIKRGVETVSSRVRGQSHAVTHMLDIVKRAVTGVGAPRRGNRPRGVAFLAGPTGVGKTELAKSLTSLLFGDDSAYIRFDMSEFSAEHADQRLIGAPPGYVGYDVGGELTNAVREKPFSVVLFDEIEKAHPRILDKFLQVLDDGVLTSGRGDRVYFSETFIIFTSNLGIFRTDETGQRVPNVTTNDPFPLVQARVRSEIEQHFKAILNRPELLNRIGDNILIFDFIRGDVAEEIFDGMIKAVLEDIEAGQAIQLSLTPFARETLATRCLSDLSNGGRGIRNKVETHLINPLARALFDMDAGPGIRLSIEEILGEPGEGTSLRLSEVPRAGASH
ncbi:AAA family ATPase [Labrys miyagiensis]